MSGCFGRRRERHPAPVWPAGVLYSDPLVGVSLKGPVVPPAATDILLGYTIVPPEKFKRGFSNSGLLATAVVAVVCWPLAWIPAALSTFYEPSQVPVYGPAGSLQPGPFTAPPEWAHGYPVDAAKQGDVAAQNPEFNYDYPVKPANGDNDKDNPEKKPLL